jgi:hypothetical protein
VVYRLSPAEFDDGGRPRWPFLIIWVSGSAAETLNRLLALMSGRCASPSSAFGNASIHTAKTHKGPRC